MAKIYAALIRKGLKTIEDVPENLREQVKALLGEERGYQYKKLNINKLPNKYFQLCSTEVIRCL